MAISKNIQTENELNNYELVKEWPRLPDNYKLGNPTGMGIDSHQNIFIFHRAERKFRSISSMPDTCISSKIILMLDRNSGKILNSWGDNLFIMPHGLTVDMNNNIWVTDVGLHQVFKFSHDGTLLMILGEAKIRGHDPAHFNLPTDVAIAKDGSIYVSDGYGNNRVMKFSSTGEYLFEWGKKGKGEGEFHLPHAIELDNDGNVYVADRENSRIQVFDPAGKFIKQWKDRNFGKISSVVFNKEKNNVIAIDFNSPWYNLKRIDSDIILFDSSGNLVGKLGNGRLKREGGGCWYHNVSVDDQGSIYVTDIVGNKLKKFEKVTND